MTRFLAAVLVLACAAFPAQSHEFWIDPLEFAVEKGAPLAADLRIGQAFKGSAYTYNPRNFEVFDIATNGTRSAVEGRAGDRPALNMTAGDDGLVSVIHVTDAAFLTYSDWSSFKAFCEHKDFTWALEAHKARGLPETGFKERYSRHAKSLIAVGDGAGQDITAGLETEIVALANPYTDDVADGFAVRVLYQGAPRADVQVEVFEQAPDDSVTVTLYRTDAAGEARISVKPGHAYLVDHVVMRALEPQSDSDPVWESLWASLTFAIPQ